MLVEFLVKIAAEATLVTTIVAGVRRTVGMDFPRMMLPKITNDKARFYAEKYLDLGEFCCDKALKLINNARNQKITTGEDATKKATEKLSNNVEKK